MFVLFLGIILSYCMVFFSNAKHGVYKIKSSSVGDGYSNVYCHMTSMSGCSGEDGL